MKNILSIIAIILILSSCGLSNKTAGVKLTFKETFGIGKEYKWVAGNPRLLHQKEIEKQNFQSKK